VTWYVLGFTPDDVVATWQDSRLAHDFVRAWEADGRPAGFRVLQGGGEGIHLVHWYVDEAAVLLFDRHGVDWRRFLVGERAAPPAEARDALVRAGPDAS
jgi:hypothetical protein